MRVWCGRPPGRHGGGAHARVGRALDDERPRVDLRALRRGPAAPAPSPTSSAWLHPVPGHPQGPRCSRFGPLPGPSHAGDCSVTCIAHGCLGRREVHAQRGARVGREQPPSCTGPSQRIPVRSVER